MIRHALVHVPDGSLGGVRVHGRHVAQHLAPVDADPVEGRVGEDVAARKRSECDSNLIYSTFHVHVVPSTPTRQFANTYLMKITNSPRQLLREEILHPRQPYQLGIRAGEAERIRQPRRLAPHPKARLEVLLAVEELPDQCLAGGHVGVVLDPGAADELEFALEDLLLDALEERGV